MKNTVVVIGDGNLYHVIKRVLSDNNDLDVLSFKSILCNGYNHFSRRTVFVLAVTNFDSLIGMDKVFDYRAFSGNIVLNLSPMTIAQIEKIDSCLSEVNAMLVSGSVVSLYKSVGTDDSLVNYSGDQIVYNKISFVVDTLRGKRYLGNSINLAPLIGNAISWAVYSNIYTMNVSLALCKQYQIPIQSFIHHIDMAVPLLCEAAYRNIWKELSDSNTYDEYDDDIHGMEMIVCKMKKEGSKCTIVDNLQQQTELINTLSQIWEIIIIEYKKTLYMEK